MSSVVRADHNDARADHDDFAYKQTNLVSDGAVPARITDPQLKNPWGIAAIPGSPFWIADNGTGVSTLYSGVGDIVPLTVTIPPPKGSPKGTDRDADRNRVESERTAISRCTAASGAVHFRHRGRHHLGLESDRRSA